VVEVTLAICSRTENHRRALFSLAETVICAPVGLFSREKAQKTQKAGRRGTLAANLAPETLFDFASFDVSASQPEKLFYTGPVINAEMLVVMLEKHDINARQEFDNPDEPDTDDLNRLAKVFVPESDYDRAYALFYVGREDEL